ncbi:MAG TPA: carbonic anhydrase [Thermotogota bacterium]|nr:carbonic anhydrase [Thermotogota bacterium]HQN21469.1 carbonic anhydrase [Thermotogota bacterium]
MKSCAHQKISFSDLLKANRRFSEHRDIAYFESFTESQAPLVTLVICSDSRIQLCLFEEDETNRFFVVRNIGNQLGNNWGSIDYGILHLKTPILFILGHVRCGAVKAALSDYSHEGPAIKNELNGLHLPLSGMGGSGDFESTWLSACERNVRFQVDEAAKRYADRIGTGELEVRGAMYDFANLYEEGYGIIHPL